MLRGCFFLVYLMKMNINSIFASTITGRDHTFPSPPLGTLALLWGGAFWILAAGLMLINSWWQSSSEYSAYLWQSDGLRLTTQTLWLAMVVLLGTWLLGSLLAFLTTLVEFRGRKLATLLALVPLAIPSYVMGFVWLSWFDYMGPVQSTARKYLGTLSWDFLGSGFLGLALSMILSLFPYVYVLVRLRLQSIDRHMIEASRSLGMKPLKTLLHLMLPLLWPAFLASGFLVLMEVISDFGTVAVFSYDTFTTAIFKAWYGFFDLWGALQLASLLWLISWALYGASEWLRFKKHRHKHLTLGESFEPLPPLNLSPIKKIIVMVFTLSLLTIAAVLPLGTLISLATEATISAWPLTLKSFFHSLVLAAMATAVVLGFSLLALWLARSWNNHPIQTFITWPTRLLNLGYAFPGAVLAVALFTVATSLERFLNLSGGSLAASLIFLIGAMSLYVMAVGFGALTQGYDKIPHELDESAQLLGNKGWRLFTKIHLPLLHYPLLFGGLLVFVDVLKEMPLTLMLRPVNYAPLTVKVYEWTSEGEWAKAALPSLAIVTLSLMVLIWFLRTDKLSERIPWIRMS